AGRRPRGGETLALRSWLPRGAGRLRAKTGSCVPDPAGGGRRLGPDQSSWKSAHYDAAAIPRLRFGLVWLDAIWDRHAHIALLLPPLADRRPTLPGAGPHTSWASFARWASRGR